MEHEIIKNLPKFLEILYGNSDNISFLEKLYDIYIKADININFDSSRFYITKEKNDLGIPINETTDVALLRTIVNLIEQREMGENIKNVSSRIHFREYKNNVILDSKFNTIRCAAFLVATTFISIEYILEFLITKRMVLLNDILRFENESDDKCTAQQFEYRVKCIFKTLLKHRALSDHCDPYKLCS